MIKFLLLFLITFNSYSVEIVKDNSFKIGKKDNQDIYIYARNGSANEPFIFYDWSDSKWKQSSDGLTITNIGGLDNVTDDAQLKREAGDFNTFTEEVEPQDADIVLIESAGNTYAKRKVQITNLIAGSGGGSFQWQLGDVAPVEEFENNVDVLSFTHTSSLAEIYAMAIVPVKYRAGDQIQLIGSKIYTPASSGNILIRTVTTLLRDGDIVTSLTNQHTSTNTELTVSASNTVIDLGNIDLTDVSGQINGIAVAPSDTLIIRFYRDTAGETSSATDYAKFIKYSSSVSFKP